MDPLHRVSGGPLAKSRITTWIGHVLVDSDEKQVFIRCELVELVFKLLGLGIWLFAVVSVSDGLPFRLMTAISVSMVAGSLSGLALLRRMTPMEPDFKRAHAAVGALAGFVVVAFVAGLAFLAEQPAWFPCAAFLAAREVHSYLLRRFVGPETSASIASTGECLLKWKGFITAGSGQSAAYCLAWLLFMGYANGMLNTDSSALRAFYLSVSGVSGGVIAVVTMLGILLLQSFKDLEMPKDTLARGLQGFALAFVLLLGASLAASLILPAGQIPVVGKEAIAGAQAYAGTALLLFVVTSLPYSLLYFLSLVWDVLRQKTGA